LRSPTKCLLAELEHAIETCFFEDFAMFLSKSPRRTRLGFDTLEARLTPANNPLLVPPILNSLPGARATLYLDFNGNTDASFTPTNPPGPVITNIDTPPFDRDGNPNNFNAAEMNEMYAIWRYVAEDFLPFNINVSTVQPASFAPFVSQRVAIGGNGSWLPGGFVGAFAPSGFSNVTLPQTVTDFVFSALSTNNKRVADLASNLAGASFGLADQTLYPGAIVNPGLPDGTAPLAGRAYATNNTRSLWWTGTTTSATTIQNDISVIGSALNRFGFRADDYGNTIATALNVNNTTNPSYNFTAYGQINTVTDVDVFRFSSKLGIVNIDINVPEPYNNLDVRARLFDINGILLVDSNPSTSFNAAITYATRYAGDYFLVISSSGPSAGSTPQNVGANIGSYSISSNIINLAVYAPTRWVYDPRTALYSGFVTVISNANVNGPYNLNFIAPPGVTVRPSATTQQLGNQFRVKFNATLPANTPSQFLIQVKNPLNANLGTYYKSFLTNFFVS